MSSLSETLAAGAAFLVGACAGGGDDAPATLESSARREEATAVCAGSVEGMNGRPCEDAGLLCTVPIDCGALMQQAQCRCDDGRFVCEDAVARIAVGGAARCAAQDSASRRVCPPDVRAAEGASCDRVGSACFYRGVSCPERPVRHFDHCACERREDGTLTYACTVSRCAPLGAKRGARFGCFAQGSLDGKIRV